MKTWKLSKTGRALPYADWIRMGGCAIPGDSMALLKLGPISHWPKGLTLGEIEDACPYSGRSLARFAIEHLGKGAFVVPYQS